MKNEGEIMCCERCRTEIEGDRYEIFDGQVYCMDALMKTPSAVSIFLESC